MRYNGVKEAYLFGALAVLNYIGAAQAAMFGTALMLRPSAPHRDRLLGCLSLSVGCFIVGAVLYSTTAVLLCPHLAFVHEPILFTCAPLLYLYVRECLSPIGLRRRDALHAIPALVCLAVLVPAYTSTAEAKILLLKRAYEGVLPWYVYRSAAILAQSAIYIVLILWAAKRARPRPGEPGDNRATRTTLRLLVAFVCVAFILGVLRLLTMLGIAGSMEIKQNLLIPLIGSVLFGYLSFAALRRGGLADSMAAGRKPRRTIPAPPDITQEQRGKLLHAMETGRAYLDPELSLQRLADQVGMPSRLLSDLINREFGQNVTDFINSYRIEEAKRRICDESYRNTTLLALAEDVGFKSKSNFNLLFKRQTTMTPTEYRRAVSQPD